MTEQVIPLRRHTYNTVWISDLHLGCRSSHSERLLDFLQVVSCRSLYLVGDVFDLLRLRRNQGRWLPQHGAVVQRLLALQRTGTRIVYLPGNHDAAVRGFAGQSFSGVEIRPTAVHRTADGRSLLVAHGDGFDRKARRHTRLEAFGDRWYGRLLLTERAVNRIRRRLGLPHCFLAAKLKTRSRTASEYIRRFEAAALDEARSKGLDGVVCGHIHHPRLVERDNLHYANTGDWVESFSAVTETLGGELQLLHWTSDSVKQQKEASGLQIAGGGFGIAAGCS